jgi:hypothetical protein
MIAPKLRLLTMKWEEMLSFFIWAGAFQVILLITALEQDAISLFLLGLIPLGIGTWFGVRASKR